MTDQPDPIPKPQSVHTLQGAQGEELEYVGFWLRLLASLIDTVLFAMIFYPVLYTFYGREYFSGEQLIGGSGDFILTHVLPAIAVIVFWVYRSATPGKMAIHAKIVDAKTGLPPSTGQLIGRYLAYYVSTIPLCLGFLWVAWDPRKQGWHDKLAGTVVVRPKGGGTKKVVFETSEKE
jgi:uncharacterized RDD family membrane protein YckC